MGVFALTSFCNEHAEAASELVNLSATAREYADTGKQPLTLLVDGLAFFHEIIEATSPSWEWVLGGNYPAISAAVEQKIQAIQGAGVHLSIFLDPAPGTEGEKKAHELDLRFQQRAKNTSKVMQLLHEGEELHEWEDEEVHIDWNMPPLASKQAVSTLKRLGVAVATCDREADEELGHQLKQMPEAFGIVSSDSDFFIMSGVRYLPLKHLKIEEGEVWARVFTPESVAKALGIPAKRLHELAALCGNDIVGEFVDKHNLPSVLQIPAVPLRGKGTRCTPTDVASFLLSLPSEDTLERHASIQALVANDADFAAALKANAAFYARESRAVEDPPASGGALGQLLLSGLKDCSLPYAALHSVLPASAVLQPRRGRALLTRTRRGSVLALSRHGVYMSSVKVEPITAAESAIDSMLRPLRSVLYALLRSGQPVTEHVRRGHGRVEKEVEGVRSEVMQAAVGTSDLLAMRAMAEHKRQEVLHVLAHLATDASALTSGSHALADLVEADPLCSLSETIMVVIGDEVKEILYQPVGLVLRQALLLQSHPASGDGEGAAGIVMSSWDFECLIRTAFLLACGVDSTNMPRHCPSARAVEVSASFLAAYAGLQSLAQLLDLPSYLPEPAKLFDGRLFAHLHSHTDAAVALLREHEDDIPKDEINVLRDALLGVFVDPAGVLCELGFGDGEYDDADEPPKEILGHGSMAPEGDGAAVPQSAAALNLETLPIHEHRDRIMSCIESNQVTCIQGETGCGKSSMVPQFLVDHAVANSKPVKVIVTQPRRLAAVTLARRVASQRGDTLGNSVGYRIGQGDHVDSKNTVVTFVTVGYFLQFLSHNPHHFSRKEAPDCCAPTTRSVRFDRRRSRCRYTHIVVDEVHERSMDTDLLNLLIKKLLEQKASKTRLIVMSATLQSGLFGEYFTPKGHVTADPIFVGARRYPVQDIFIEELIGAIPALRHRVGNVVNRVANQFEIASKATDTKGKLLEGAVGLVKPEVSPDGRRVLVETVLHLAQEGSCILVFLPGIGEIASLQDELDQAQLGHNSCQAELQILVLHSLVPKDEQEAAMAPAKPGCCKVILSTNIAESSITIPDVRFVIDTGLHRGIFYDDKRQMPSLLCTWCAQASARQRAGRAGRVAPGTIIYLFTREFHSVCMPEFDEAEILRVPLEKTVLRVKLLLSRFGSVTDLLQQSVTPPPPARVLTAIKVLYQAGALTTETEDGEVSELGRLAADMPVDLPLVKLLLLGRAFGCLTDTVVMAAALTLQDPFLMPSNVFMRDQGHYIRELQANLVARVAYDKGSYSEPLAYLEVYKSWMKSDKQVRWARSEGLSHARMRQLDMLVADLSSKMQSLLDSTAQDAALLAKLSRLYSSSRRTGHQREADSAEQGAGKLFSPNLHLLRFVLAGACAPIFLQGAVQPEGSSKDLKELARAGFNISRSVVLTKMPKEICNERALFGVLKASGIQPRQGAFKQLSDDRAAVEMSPHRLDDIKPDGRPGSEKLVLDVSLYVKLLLQLHVSNQRKLVLPNPRGAQGSADGTILIKGVSVERQVVWQLSGTSGMQVLPYWRAPLASMSDLDDRNSHRFGVALSLLGTEQELKVRAIGVTVLPEGLFSKVLQIIFTPPDQAIRVCCDEDHDSFFAATVGSSMVSFEPAVLSLRDMGSINQIRRIVSDAIAGGSGQQPQATLETLLSLLMRPPEAMEKQRGKDKVKRKWVPCTLEDSVDYLPQVRLNLDQADKVGIGGGEASARAAAGGEGVRISLLCSDDFNVAAQLPPGYWIDTREECASGTHSWHEICIKKVESDVGKFKDQMQVLFKWFKGATVFDRHAVLEFPSTLSNEQRKHMHDLAQKKMGLATHSSGPKSDRRLMLCRDMSAIKHIQKRGGVASVAQGGGTLNLGKKAQAPLPLPSSPLAAIQSPTELLAALKPLVHACLLDFHPQGLPVDVLPSEFANKFGQPLPLTAFGNAKLRVRDVLGMLSDTVAVVPGEQAAPGRPGKERVVAILPSSSQDSAPQPPPPAAAPGAPGAAGQTAPAAAPPPMAVPSEASPPAAAASGGARGARAGGEKRRGGELESELRERVRALLAAQPKGLSATKIEEALGEGAGRRARLGRDGKDRRAFLLGVCHLREDAHRYFLPGPAPADRGGGAGQGEGAATATGMDDKGRLFAACQKQRLGKPQYVSAQVQGQWEAVLVLPVGGAPQRIVGRGAKKVLAEQAAAQLALSALAGRPAPLELQTCFDCGAVGPGDVDVTDGNYYCMQCWEAFQTASKVEAMTLQPQAPAPPPQSNKPQAELSKDEKLLSYLSKEEAMGAVLRKAISQCGGALGLQEAHAALEGVRSHGSAGLSPGLAPLAQWLIQGATFALDGKGSAATVRLKA